MSTRRKHLQRYQIEKILQERKIVLFYQCSHVRADKWESIKKGLLSGMTGDTLEKAQNKLVPPLTSPASLSGGSLDTISRATPFTTLLVKNRIGQQCHVLERLIPNSTHTTEHLIDQVPTINFADQGVSSGDASRSEAHQKSAVVSNSLPMLIKDQHWYKISLKLFQGPTFVFACNSHREMVLGCEIIDTKSQRETSLTLLGGIYYGKIMNHLDVIQLAKLDQRVHRSLASCLEETISCLLYNALSFHQSRLLLYLHYYAATLFDSSATDPR